MKSDCAVGDMLRENGCEALPEAASVTVTFTVEVPLTVGMPVMSPEAPIPSPSGRPVAENVYGCVPPVAMTVEE
jgi:hypothetical protein